MRTIFKYTIPVNDDWHEVPAGRVVEVGPSFTSDAVFVWVEHYTQVTQKARLRVFSTGQEIPDEAVHVGVSHSDPFVWHVYSESAI